MCGKSRQNLNNSIEQIKIFVYCVELLTVSSGSLRIYSLFHVIVRTIFI